MEGEFLTGVVFSLVDDCRLCICLENVWHSNRRRHSHLACLVCLESINERIYMHLRSVTVCY